jgi:hypothetical protein
MARVVPSTAGERGAPALPVVFALGEVGAAARAVEVARAESELERVMDFRECERD